MIKNILTYPENKDILIMKSEKVLENNDEIKTIIQDLKDTLNNTDGGVGISAIQIGVPKQICIIKYNNKFITLINPSITRQRGNIQFREGCLSAPGKYKNINRAEKIWCTYLDENFVSREISQGGLLSVIIQHEIEHFDGWCKVFDEE